MGEGSGDNSGVSADPESCSDTGSEVVGSRTGSGAGSETVGDSTTGSVTGLSEVAGSVAGSITVPSSTVGSNAVSGDEDVSEEFGSSTGGASSLLFEDSDSKTGSELPEGEDESVESNRFALPKSLPSHLPL